MKMLLRVCALVAFVVFGSGCLSSTTYHTATPVEVGETEIGITPGATGFQVSADGESAGLTLPTVGIAFRTGLSDNVDLGVRSNGLTVVGDVNIAVLNDSDFALSIDPTVSFFYISAGDGSFLWLLSEVLILADVVKSEAVTLTIGVKPGYFFTSADTTDDDFTALSDGAFTVGGVVGAKFWLTETLALMPMLDVATPADGFGDVVFYNAGVAVLF